MKINVKAITSRPLTTDHDVAIRAVLGQLERGERVVVIPAAISHVTFIVYGADEEAPDATHALPPQP